MTRKKKAGRPRVGTVRLNLTIDETSLRQLKEIEDAYDATSMSEVIRMAVRFYYKHGDWWPEKIS